MRQRGSSLEEESESCPASPKETSFPKERNRSLYSEEHPQEKDIKIRLESG